MTVSGVIRSLCADPMELLIRRWNWKSALLSPLFRGLIFFCANLTAGLRAAEGALVTELCYRALTAGFYGALTQSFSTAEPAWAATLVALALLPLGSHSLEFAVHVLRHTPNLAVSFTSSICFTALSTLFHLYAMRRGALLVRSGATSLVEDMSRMPRLLVGFIVAGPLTLVASLAKTLPPQPRTRL
jgi:hypothetical protein